ncbi:hypothetical protein F5Y04DRAFT_24904 [Hypomontagnella monticulosa]|nr:hypothetical protein F5Y04DRAFT_24904 [Hypomontagnella monticulosa]
MFGVLILCRFAPHTRARPTWLASFYLVQLTIPASFMRIIALCYVVNPDGKQAYTVDLAHPRGQSQQGVGTRLNGDVEQGGPSKMNPPLLTCPSLPSFDFIFAQGTFCLRLRVKLEILFA